MCPRFQSFTCVEYNAEVDNENSSLEGKEKKAEKGLKEKEKANTEEEIMRRSILIYHWDVILTAVVKVEFFYCTSKVVILPCSSLSCNE